MSLTILVKSFCSRKQNSENIWMRNVDQKATNSFLLIFCEMVLNSLVIKKKSIIDQDDTFWRNSQAIMKRHIASSSRSPDCWGGYKVLPLTVCCQCLSPLLQRFNIPADALGLGSGFCQVLQFPPPLTTDYKSQISLNMAEKVTTIKMHIHIPEA